jgi:hypothetical protein
MNELSRLQSSRWRTVGMLFAIVAFLVPYTVGWGWGWWKFVGASLVIILSMRWAKPQTFISELGIRIYKADIGLAGISLLLVGVIASYVIPKILHPLGYVPGIPYSHVWKYLATPFQALNEEMVLRAFLLTIFMRLLKRPIVVSLVVAALFTVLHFLLYRFGPPNTALSFKALTTLFLVALALNQFFFTTGNIAIPFGIHLGWNFTRFSNDWIAQSSGGNLPDGMDFNLIEGNFMVVAFAAVLVVVAIGTNRAFGNAPNFRTASLV